MNIGFIGLGSIGFPIFSHIVSKNDVYFYARKKDVIDCAIECGGHFVESIQELTTKANIIFLFVNTFDQCVDCVNQISKAKTEYTLVIVGATIAPQEIKELGEKYRDNNIYFCDAPVTGGVKGAQDGSLTTMISGEESLKSKVIDIINLYSKKIIDVGSDIGKAESLKALVQLLVGINSVAMAEVFTLGIKSGLSAEIIYDTIINSAGSTRIFENRGQKVIDRDFNKRGTINIINKDMTICSKLAFDKQAPLFLGAIAKQMFQIASSQNDPMEDFNAIVKVYEQIAGITIKREEDV